MKVCFVCLTINSIFEDSNPKEIIGGSEIQQYLLAKELVKKGVEVSFITLSNKQFYKKFGFKIFGIKESNKGILGKIITGKRLLNAMEKADADIYYQRVGETTTGIVAYFCKKHKKKFIYNSAHDEDSKKSSFLRSNFSNIFYSYGIVNSDKIIVQNKIQKKNFLKYFDKKTKLIPNGVELDALTKGGIDNSNKVISDGKYFLWISTIRAWKQPELFIKLAKRNRDIDFIMIGGADISNKNGKKYYNKVKKIAKEVKNLDFKGFVKYKKSEEFIKNCIAVVNTSKTEGFPNSYLQAWKYGIPIISMHVDPNGIIEKYKLGYLANDFEKLEKMIRKIYSDIQLRVDIGKNALKYIKENHDIKIIAEKYYNTFLEVLN